MSANQPKPYIDKSRLHPINVANLIRLGNKFDGGYIVPPDLVEKTETLLSLGINDDWRFDKQFQQRNPDCKVVGVDHTVGLWFVIRKSVQNAIKTVLNTLLLRSDKRNKYAVRLINCLFFYSFFKGKNKHLQNKVSAKTQGIEISLSDLIKCHASDKDLATFLKMDIEGSEYEIIDDLIANADKINVIAAEFHFLDSKNAQFNTFFDKVLQHFHVVHIHGNNFGAYRSSIDFPETVEITLVNRKLLEDVEPSTKNYPVTGLDFPNNPKKDDYKLTFNSL
jgi:hypothetical protein